MEYLIKEVADMVGISVRMLHHYDKIGLLKIESLTTAGYRLYNDRDLERLQQILFFKELDFSLQEIKEILDSPSFDKEKALKSHRELLLDKKKRLDRIINTLDKTIDSIEGGFNMDKREMFEGFDMSEIEKHKEKYAEETKERWGNTDAYKESQRRTSKYSKEDWARIKAEGDEVYKRLASLMDRDPGCEEVQRVVEAARNNITRNFYECTPEIFRGLGEMYVNDPRFTANIDKYGQGLAEFLSRGIKIYCDRLEK